MIKLPAARKADLNSCPAHGPGRIGKPAQDSVLIGGLPAARRTDRVECSGGVEETITEGSPSVLICGLEAARKSDATTHNGVIMTGFSRVLIGGWSVPTSQQETLNRAMNHIRTSEFAKTEEGKKVLAKLEEFHKNGRIRFQKLGPGLGGGFGAKEGPLPLLTGDASDEISVSEAYARDPDSTASELVHEGTHGAAAEEVGAHPNTIDEEMRTNSNQLDFYDEQRQAGHSDEALDAREDWRKRGVLREQLPAFYPDAEEH